MRTNERYYISSGEKNKMYTLRVSFMEPVYSNGPMGAVMIGMTNRDWFVKSLATTKERALEKARDYVGENYEIKFELGEINRGEARKNELPVDVLRFGKYFGMTVEEVKEKDPQYLIWLADNYTNEKHQGMIDYVKMVMKEELEKRDSEFAEALHKEEELKFERAKVLSEIGEELVKLDWDFPQRIGADLIKGQLPKGRGKHLVCDMMGKRLARRRSKKYNAEYDRVEELINMAEAIK